MASVQEREPTPDELAEYHAQVAALTARNVAAASAVRHPATYQVLRWFDHAHLPDGPLKDTSRQCQSLANAMVGALPDGPELTTGLRKLLEAKDCFVRVAVAQQNDEPRG